MQIKIVPKVSKIRAGDLGPGAGIRDPRSGKTHLGSRTQGSKRHRITDPDPQQCL